MNSGLVMPTHKALMLTDSLSVRMHADGKSGGSYIRGFPRHAAAAVKATAPFLCGPRMFDYTIEVAGQARPVQLG